MTSSPPASLARIGVLMRFKNSARTLPAVLAALRAQTLPPDLIVGIDNGSTDDSAALLRAAGATVVSWPFPYHHSKILNFGFAHCPAERILVVSSHTVLESVNAVALLNEALDDPKVACASAKWDDDPYFSDAIDWPELQAKGLKFGAIYSNSFGLMRRDLWTEVPLDEGVPPIEDFVWAVEQVRRGYVVRRVHFAYSYQRSAFNRDFLFAAGTFALADRHGLRVAWLGWKASFLALLKGWPKVLAGRASELELATWRTQRARLWAALAWRWTVRGPQPPVLRQADSTSTAEPAVAA